MHLPVSPTCNIQCRFCRRSFNKNEDRPGVARRLLAPEEAVGKVRRALELCPDITVVGISGLGDTLATDHAIRTFAAVHQAYPHLIKCLSTNGLNLADRATALWNVGVRTITVTVNAVDPEILERICAWVVWRGARLKGRPAAEWLITQQFRGIRLMADLGVLVKINTVLIPGVNDFHVAELARNAAGLGAARINLIPLIPQHEMSGIPAPSCAALERRGRTPGASSRSSATASIVGRTPAACPEEITIWPLISMRRGSLRPSRMVEGRCLRGIS